jgi:biopolymer transport protein ExbB
MNAVSVRGLAAAIAIMATGASLAQAAPAMPTFEQAYRRERAQLQATFAALKKQLAAQRRDQAARKRAQSARVQALLKKVSALREKSRELEAAVKGLEKQSETVSDHGDLLAGTLSAAAATLGDYGVAIKSKEPAALLTSVVKAGCQLVERFSSIQKEPGRFFDLKGKRRNGTVVRIGRVGALGFSRDGSVGGVLRNAPGGGLRLIRDPVFDRAGSPLKTAKRLAAGERPRLVPAFLFDPKAKASDPPTHRGLWSMARAGGVIAWIILVLGALGLLLVLERILMLLRLANWRPRFIPGLIKQVEAGDARRALAATRRMGAAGRVLSAIIEKRGAPRADLEEIASEQVLKQLPAVERSIALIGVIVTVAPLLGLLGTVTGMISTFDVITLHGTGDPKLLSHGISEALITTEFGLAVAVPLLLLKSFVSRWADRLVDSMQTQALVLINVLCTNHSIADGASDENTSDGPVAELDVDEDNAQRRGAKPSRPKSGGTDEVRLASKRAS